MSIFITALDRYLHVFYRLWGRINYLYSYFWGIKIGKGVAFLGKTHFFRLKNTELNIGDNCSFSSSVRSNWIGINRPCMISVQSNGGKLIIGNNCGFSGTVIGAFKMIKLGNNVRCGANSLITDSDWHLDDPRTGPPLEVIIEDNVWLGVNSVVLKGVTIGENSVIGANSVVTKNIPPNVIAAGNPCKVIKQLTSNNISDRDDSM